MEMVKLRKERSGVQSYVGSNTPMHGFVCDSCHSFGKYRLEIDGFAPR